jgi:hypothetical protein
MDWKATLNAQIQQMRNDNNARFRGGYTGPAIRDHEFENKRIDTFMKNQIDHFQAIDLKELEKTVESKNKFLKNILLALPSKEQLRAKCIQRYYSEENSKEQIFAKCDQRYYHKENSKEQLRAKSNQRYYPEKKLVTNTIVVKDTIKINLEDIHKDINYWSSLAEV